MISKEQVKRVAHLARLGLSQKEIEKMQKELSMILEYVEKLNKVNVSEIKFFDSGICLKNVMREDKESRIKGSKKLLDLAPQQQSGYLKTRQIL